MKNICNIFPEIKQLEKNIIRKGTPNVISKYRNIRTNIQDTILDVTQKLKLQKPNVNINLVKNIKDVKGFNIKSNDKNYNINLYLPVKINRENLSQVITDEITHIKHWEHNEDFLLFGLNDVLPKVEKI